MTDVYHALLAVVRAIVIRRTNSLVDWDGLRNRAIRVAEAWINDLTAWFAASTIGHVCHPFFSMRETEPRFTIGVAETCPGNAFGFFAHATYDVDHSLFAAEFAESGRLSGVVERRALIMFAYICFYVSHPSGSMILAESRARSIGQVIRRMLST
jgi:hypothetical protein